jgi:hypothetical protein
MAPAKMGFFDQLLQVSKGELDLFRDATDAFVRTAESTDLSENSTKPLAPGASSK